LLVPRHARDVADHSLQLRTVQGPRLPGANGGRLIVIYSVSPAILCTGDPPDHLQMAANGRPLAPDGNSRCRQIGLSFSPKRTKWLMLLN